MDTCTEAEDFTTDEGFFMVKKRRKGMSKDPNPEWFWEEFDAIIDVTKLKESNQKYGSTKITNEIAKIHPQLTVRKTKKILGSYFYDSKEAKVFRKSQDNEVPHRECLTKQELIEKVKKNHETDHRKSDSIYEALRRSVFPVVRENISLLFKTEVRKRLHHSTCIIYIYKLILNWHPG